MITTSCQRLHRVRGRAALAALVATAFMLAAPAAQAGAQTDNGNKSNDKPEALATLKVTAQTVEVQSGGKGEFKKAKDGDKLHEGDTVRTDATGGAEIDYTDDSYTRLDVNTSFTVQTLTDEQGNRHISGTLNAGQTWNRTAALSESETFEQQGAGATAAVVGTAFAVQCDLASHCTFTAVVDNIKLSDANGVVKVLTPLDQCDSTSGALCADITKIDPSELPGWIFENLVKDLMERGITLPEFLTGTEGTLIIDESGNAVFVPAQSNQSNNNNDTPPPPPPPPPASGQIIFDGSPGTGAPPATLGGYPMSSFALDLTPWGTNETSLAAPGGGFITFDKPMSHRIVAPFGGGFTGWCCWSHGYSSDVYCSDCGTGNVDADIVTITLPANTLAFYLYAMNDLFGTENITAIANDGTSSGAVQIITTDPCAGADECAKYFGFYSTGGGTYLQSITVSTSNGAGLGIGEFGIYQDPNVSPTSEAPVQQQSVATPPPDQSTPPEDQPEIQSAPEQGPPPPPPDNSSTTDTTTTTTTADTPPVGDTPPAT